MNRLLVACLLFPLAASAAEAPQQTVDMTVILKGVDGKTIVDQLMAEPGDPTCKNCPPLTLGHAISHALYAPFEDEKALSADQKWARGFLAQRIQDEPRAVLSAKEIVVIKNVVGKMYGAVVVTRVFPMLDPGAKPPEVQ